MLYFKIISAKLFWFTDKFPVKMCSRTDERLSGTPG